ncbi:MAG: hypothetical protein DMF61_05740 [Blastocatellia bacterium AA13]|nr:MAG: hypothetical protein DMF61_05740 [Blastocatellia bacterium AA13]
MNRLHRIKMLSSSAIFLILSSLALPFSVVTAFAQATTGSIKGVVTDPSGAVIPGADVTAKGAATGVETKTKTNGEGLYAFPSLTPGEYLVTVQKAGFKKQEFQQVTVSIGQETTIDAALQTGQITETVTVTATGQELIQREQVQVSQTIESRKVSELPSNIAGGGIDTLALLVPGVVPGNAGVTNVNGTDLSVNGNRTRSNNFTIDGGDNNDLSISGPAFFVNNQDLVGEFQIITNNFSAEYGRNQGAIVNIVTKTGTNQFHGSGFWFHRDRSFLDTLDNIEKRAGDRNGPDPLLYNVIGGTFGGPIVKDHLFFFGSYQGITLRQVFTARSESPAVAPEELSRLKAAFPNSPAVDAIVNFSAFAIPFGGVTERTDKPRDATVNIGGRNFRVAYPQRSFGVNNNENEFSIRGDFKPNTKDTFWYRHLYQRDTNDNAIPTIMANPSNGFFGSIPSNSTYGTASWTRQISNSAVNEFRFTFNKLSVSFGGGCDPATPGCVPDAPRILQEFPQITFGFRASSGDILQQVGPDSGFPQGRTVHNYQFADYFSKTLGLHQLKAGVDIRRVGNTVPFLPSIAGTFAFSTAARVVSNLPSTFSLAVGNPIVDYTETDQFYFIQDDWRVRDNLTLNLGLRYEYNSQPINRLHDLTVARENDPSQALWRQSLPLDARTVPRLPTDKNNWAPRVGFAWRPRFGKTAFFNRLFGEQDKTVISGGYSIAYDPQFYNILLNISNSSPFVFLTRLSNPSLGLPPGSGPTAQTIQDFARANGLIATNTFDPRFFSQTIVDPHFHSPYSEQWSLRIQREINRTNVVEIRYVGTHGVGLFQQNNANPVVSALVNGMTRTIGGDVINFPSFANLLPSGITPVTCVNNLATPDNEAACNGRVLPQGLLTTRYNGAQSIYHGFQTRYQGRLGSQLLFGAAYTFSKALDNASEIFFTNFGRQTPQNPFDTTRSERSFSGFDRRHALALNFIWDIPFHKDQHGLVGRTLGGWQLNGTYFIQSGTRFTPSQFFNVFLVDDNGLPTTYGDPSDRDTFRPFYGNPRAPRDTVGISQVDAALIFGVPISNLSGFYSFNDLNLGNVKEVTKDQVRYIFNGPGAARIFGTPFGNVARNSGVGPILNQLNLGLFKNVKLGERVSLQLRMETFNALNHPNPGLGFSQGAVVPDQFVEDAGTTFGRFDEMELSRRVVQLGVRVIF